MKTLQFPLLRADQIDLRIGQMNGDGNKARLLLYKDARVDMDVLDEVVGCYNWQREHKEIKGVCYCGVSIWDNEKSQWITKWDAGKESNTEGEKGEASDSFKRACVNLGIGRELYTAPEVWVEVKTKYDKFYVKEIGYNDKNEINKLSIVDAKGVPVYERGGNGYNKVKKETTEQKPSKDYRDDIFAFLQGLSYEQRERFNNKVLKNEFGVERVIELEPEQARQVWVKYCNRNGGNND